MKITKLLCFWNIHDFNTYNIDGKFKVGGPDGVTQEEINKMGYFQCARCDKKKQTDKQIITIFK